MVDEKIGWLFTDVAELDLEEHIPKIASFWATNLLGSKSYKGGAFGVHGRLHQKAPGGLRQEHFERWLVLWCQTVDELFDGPLAAAAKVHALRVANASTVASRCTRSARRQASPPPDRRRGSGRGFRTRRPPFASRSRRDLAGEEERDQGE